MHPMPVGYASSNANVAYTSTDISVIVVTVVDHAGLGSCMASVPHSGC